MEKREREREGSSPEITEEERVLVQIGNVDGEGNKIPQSHFVSRPQKINGLACRFAKQWSSLIGKSSKLVLVKNRFPTSGNGGWRFPPLWKAGGSDQFIKV